MSAVYVNLMHELTVLVPYAVGFGYSLIAGLLIWRTHEHLYSKFHTSKSIGWRSSITGLVERGLYTAAILTQHSEFIAVWLTLKSVSHWDRFKSDIKSEKSKVEATAKFNGYFVDTGLSIAYGLTGALVTNLFIARQYATAIVVMIALFVTHLFLNLYVFCQAEKERSSEPKRFSHRNLVFSWKKKKLIKPNPPAKTLF